MSLYEKLVRRLYQVNMFHPAKMGLTNTLRLHEEMGRPLDSVKSIHIAGTNGKGSVAWKMARALQSAGYTTGLFLSPHISCFRERMQVNGQLIPEDQVCRLLTKVFDVCDRENIPATFFEVTAVMAFCHFADSNADLAVLETGLGGRLDSTNIVQPKLAIITSVGLDHTHILGNTIDLVAREKGGIIKPSVPVILGDNAPHELLESIAAEQDAKAYHIHHILKEDDGRLDKTLEGYHGRSHNISDMKWQEAIEALQGMKAAGIRPGRNAYSHVVRTCSKACKWDQAWEFIGEMKGRGLAPTEQALQDLMGAAGKEGKWGAVRLLFAELMKLRESKRSKQPTPPARADYDTENSLLAESGLRLLAKTEGLEIGYQNILEGMKTRPPCRFETLQVSHTCRGSYGLHHTRDDTGGKEMTAEIDVVLDMAHNPMAMELLLDKLARFYPDRSYRYVVGFCHDKDYESCLRLILEQGAAPESLHFIRAAHPRAAPIAELENCMARITQDLRKGNQRGGLGDGPLRRAPVPLAGKGSSEQPMAAVLDEALSAAMAPLFGSHRNHDGCDASTGGVSDEEEEGEDHAADVLVVCGSGFFMADAREHLGICEPRVCDTTRRLFLPPLHAYPSSCLIVCS
ncbi:unnamed protein product [Chrysoparadoxa australica]